MTYVSLVVLCDFFLFVPLMTYVPVAILYDLFQ
jgi:hypothetical protein